MNLSAIHIFLAILLAVLAGCIGALAAGQWNGDVQTRGLHGFVHEELDLSGDQNARLEQLEERFARERQGLESALRAANTDLAQAMAEEDTYGPKVAAAIDEVHVQMGELQKTTVRHVFAMRELLNDDQQEQFDRQVWEALTGDVRE